MTRRQTYSLARLFLLALTPLAFAQDPAPALSKPAGAVGEKKVSPSEYTGFHTFEVHSANLLQKMLYAGIPLDGKPREAIDRIFAEFVRCTMEGKPRAVLIAYKGDKIVDTDGVVYEPEGDAASEFREGKINATRPFLVDLILREVAPSEMSRVQTVVRRWDKLRPPPMDGPLDRLTRAIKEPGAALTQEEREKAIAKVHELFEKIPKPDRRRGAAGKYEPEIRAQIFAMLGPDRTPSIASTLTMIEQDAAEWAEPNHTWTVYGESLKTLGLPPPGPAPNVVPNRFMNAGAQPAAGSKAEKPATKPEEKKPEASKPPTDRP